MKLYLVVALNAARAAGQLSLQHHRCGGGGGATAAIRMSNLGSEGSGKTSPVPRLQGSGVLPSLSAPPILERVLWETRRERERESPGLKSEATKEKAKAWPPEISESGSERTPEGCHPRQAPLSTSARKPVPMRPVPCAQATPGSTACWP